MSKLWFGITLTIAAVVTLFVYPEFYEAIFLFIFAGIIPFTDAVVSPMVMLVIYVLFLALLAYSFIRSVVESTNPVRRDLASRKRARQIVKRKAAVKRIISKKSPAKKLQTAVAKDEA